MEIDDNLIKQQLPDYLTKLGSEYKTVFRELKRLKESTNDDYFLGQELEQYRYTMLQGDGWTGFQYYDFTTGKIETTNGIVISNSCHISQENKRINPIKVTFAPISSLSKMRTKLEMKSVSKNRINQLMSDIRNQDIYKYFYLPKSKFLKEESVVYLEDMYTMPVSEHKDKNKIFTLNQAGFYYFIIKLSIFFCRLHENLDRVEN